MNTNQPPSNGGPFTRENEPMPGRSGITGETTPSGKASDRLDQGTGRAGSSSTGATGSTGSGASATAGRNRGQAGEGGGQKAAPEPIRRLREYGANVASAQKDRVVNEVGGLSNAARETARRLREEDDNNIAGYVEAVADRIDGAADYLRKRSAADLLADVQSIARRHPEVVVGGMFVAGLVLGRLLRVGGTQVARTATEAMHDDTEFYPTGLDDTSFGVMGGDEGLGTPAGAARTVGGSDVRAGAGSSFGSTAATGGALGGSAIGTPSSGMSGGAVDESGLVGEGTVEGGNYGGKSGSRRSGDRSRGTSAGSGGEVL